MNTGGDARMKQQLPKTIPDSAPCGLKDQGPLQLGSPPPPLFCMHPPCGSARTEGPQACTQRHRFMPSCGGVPGAGDTWTNDWFLEVLIYLHELWWSLQMCLPGIYPYTHILWHAGNLKILCRPETLPKLPSCLNILCLYFHNSQLLMEGEAQKPEHSSPGPSPEALKSNFLTWISISKLGKRLQNQICKVSPEILRIAKAQWSGFLTGTGWKEMVSEMQNQG